MKSASVTLAALIVSVFTGVSAMGADRVETQTTVVRQTVAIDTSRSPDLVSFREAGAIGSE